MEITVEHDDLGTHVDWQLDGVTPRMIDWFWSNLEKGSVGGRGRDAAYRFIGTGA